MNGSNGFALCGALCFILSLLLYVIHSAKERRDYARGFGAGSRNKLADMVAEQIGPRLANLVYTRLAEAMDEARADAKAAQVEEAHEDPTLWGGLIGDGPRVSTVGPRADAPLKNPSGPDRLEADAAAARAFDLEQATAALAEWQRSVVLQAAVARQILNGNVANGVANVNVTDLELDALHIRTRYIERCADYHVGAAAASRATLIYAVELLGATVHAG